MKVCKNCGRVLEGKRWLPPGGEEVAKARGAGELEKTVCRDCRRHPGAHSAILQLKGIPREEAEDLIIDELVRSEKKGRRENVFEKGGKYHFTSKTMARSVARALKERGAETKETTKVVSYDAQKSRQKTRITILVERRFGPGDVVEYRGRLYLVESVRRGFVHAQDGSKFRLKEAVKVKAERLKGFYLSKTPPMVFIESTRETLDVRKPGEGKVEVVRAGGRTWVREVER